MRKLILFLLICISAKVNAQVYQEMPQYGYRANRMAFDSTLQIPTVCGVPTLKSIVKVNKSGAIAYDSCNAIFYTYNPKTLTWSAVSGGGGGSTDTTSLSNRINKKIDSLKRSSDSVYAFINGVKTFQFKDSIGVAGTGSQYFVSKWSNSTTLQNSQIFDSVNVGINTTTPQYKLDVNGTGRFVNDLFADEDFVVNNYFAINTTATSFPLPDDDLGIWRRKINGAGTYFIEDEQATKDKWAFVKRSGYNSTTGWKRDSSSIVNINLGWANPNESNLDGSTLLINPTIRIGDSTKTNTKIRGIYYNPKVDSIVNTKHIAFESTSGNVVMKGLKTSSSTTDSIAIWINDTLSKAPYPSGVAGVPYTGATQDVDLGSFKISAQSFQVEGTNGLGHIHFKHQNSDATATGQSTVLYANSNGDLKYKNAGNYYSTLKTQQSADRVYTFQNKSYTLADSSDLSNKLNASDTSVFQRKSLSAYSIMANNTSATANGTAQNFKDTSGTYTGTITWNGVAPTSGNFSYRFTRIGKMVTINISLIYAVAGSANSTLIVTLPTDAPTPTKPAGLTSASNLLYPCYGNVNGTGSTTLTSSAFRGALRSNSANTGFEFFIGYTLTTPINANFTCTYFTD